ncbi:MAG: S8 family serine peptidase [Burkholderiaceae bacterium]|nr:S8 family serine peptidase [Burkholderiaceae bacterium]
MFFRLNPVLRTGLTLAGVAALANPVAGLAQTAAQAAQTELNNSKFVSQIGAVTAYGLKFTGLGVKIAVLDTGVNAASPDLAGRIVTGRNFTVATPNTSVADGNGHGTHVSGLIAANRNSVGMFGVAYSAQIMPVKVIADNGAGNTAWLNAGLRWAADQQASIANMSLGSTAAFDPAALKYAVGKGMLIVAAAGNSALAQPGWPARYASQSWANGQIINVVAVDSASKIAAWSNRAGDAMNFTLAAPGASLMSTYKTGYALMSGTSMATPVVSGAAALIRSRWTYLSAKDVANILFVTATDLGAAGVDAIYGRGLVNVDRAMKPVGQVATPAYGGKTVPLYGASAGGALAGAMKNAAQAGLLMVSGVDEYGRDFTADMSRALVKTRPLLADELFALNPAVAAPSSQGLRVSQGNAFAALPVAHLGFMDQATSLTQRLPIGAGWAMVPALASQTDKATAASLALTRTLPRDGELGVAMTQMNEQQTFLGAATQGVLGLGHSATTALALFARASIDEHTRLDASVSFGSTPAAQGSLLATTSALSQAMRVSLTRRNALVDGDGLALAFEQPMRVSGGTMSIERMVGTDAAGAPMIERGSVSMKPDGRELRLSLHYSVPMGRRGSLQLAAMHRSQPGHFADAASERAAAIRYRTVF